jgi:hypothetical protein
MLLLALCLSYTSFAQEGDPSFRELVKTFPSAAPVSSAAELPMHVQAGISEILRSGLGSIADSLKFSNGQVIHFRNVIGDSTQPDSIWVVPMYDLRFQLSDTTLGIKDYVLELRVDQKGRLIYINWPGSGFSDKTELASWEDVLAYATRFAKIAKFYTPNFRVHLQYNATLRKMVWVFRFPVKDLSSTMMLHTIEVDWQKPRLVKEYMDRYY